MENNELTGALSESKIKEKIYTIRGVQVMLDSDLAQIYGYSTKAFNQQVKNNIDKFPEDFMFKPSEQEIVNLRSNFLTSSWGGKRYLPDMHPYRVTLFCTTG